MIAVPALHERINQWLTPQRARTYPLLLFLAGASMFATSALRATNWIESNGTIVGKDYLAFYMGGEMVREGRIDTLYDFSAQQTWQQAFMKDINPNWSGTCLYLNPPHYAWMMSLLTRFGYGPSLIIWWVLSLGSFALTARILSSVMTPGRFAPVLLAAICFPPFVWALATGQNAFLTLLILTGFCALHVRNRSLAAGLVLSLLAYKFQFILVPGLVLLLTRQWRAIAGLAIGGGLTFLLTLTTTGMGSITAYVEAGSRIGGLLHTAGFDLHKQHCWTGFVALIGDGWLPVAAVKLIGAALSLATVLLIIPVLRGGWSSDSNTRALQWSAILMASLAASPHLFHYDMLIAALPVMLWQAAASNSIDRHYQALRALVIAGFAWLALSLLIAPMIRIQFSPILMSGWVILIARTFKSISAKETP